MIRRIVPLAVLAVFVATSAAWAQEAIKIGVCNAQKVLEGMDERKALEDKMKDEQSRLRAEAQRRSAEINDLKKEQSMLKPDSAQWADKQQEIEKKTIDFDVWARVTDLGITRRNKEQLRGLYQKIQDGAREVAEQKKLDLVVSEHRNVVPEGDDYEKMTIPQLRQLLGSNNVLYLNEKADITTAVLNAVNKKYAGQGGK